MPQAPDSRYFPAFTPGFCGRFRIEGPPAGRYRPPPASASNSFPIRPATMKLRSLLLVSCMLVVPALAMFSHLIPAEVRAAARRGFASATSGWLGTRAEAATVPSSGAATSPAAGKPALPSPTVETTGFLSPATAPSKTSTSLSPVATGLPPAATGGPATAAGSLPVGTTATTTTMEPASPPLVTQLADRTRQLREQQAREQQAIEAQLKSAGAVAFDCQPLPGSEGLFSSSCRVPVDATGQLQRVFQASGPDPGSASAALLTQVTAWRQRLASQQPSAAAGGADGAGPPPAGRFR